MSDKFRLLMDAVDDDLLEEALTPVKKTNPIPWVGVAIAACLLLAIGLPQFLGRAPAVSSAQLSEMGYDMKLPEEAERVRYDVVTLSEQQAAQASFVIQEIGRAHV